MSSVWLSDYKRMHRRGGLHTNTEAGRMLPVLQRDRPVHPQWCAQDFMR